MKNASLVSEIVLKMPNTVGVAKKLIHLITDEAQSNIQMFSGGVVNNKGEFAIITDDNKKVLQALKASEFKNAHETEVLVIDLSDKGEEYVYMLVDKIADAGININTFYTTELGKNQPVVVMATENNKQAMSLVV